MPITVGVTDNAWAAFLRADPTIAEANFWLPSGGSFRSLAEGEAFLFKTKAPTPAIVGGGIFQGFLELRVSEAWNFFGRGNGVGSERELEHAIETYRSRSKRPYHPDPTIGCVMLRDLFFADAGAELPQPPHWAHNIVTWKNYAPGDADWDYVFQASRVLSAQPRIDLAWEDAPVVNDYDGPRFGKPRLVTPRNGQGAFRAKVATAYDWRCAITGSQNGPALEAAHIRPYSHDGQHVVTNGLLLRRDVHKLFDDGYLGIDGNLRLHVSPRLVIDTGNGVEFYERSRAGGVVRTPENPRNRPDLEALEWHMDEVFKSA